jgi:hypothetical protein
MKRLVPLLFFGALFASCASLAVQDLGNARLVADLINAGKAEELAAMTASPFLLDQEVVPLPADAAAFWKGICAAGFKVNALETAAGRALSADSYKEFGDTYEARLFFQKYVDKDSRLLELESADGRRVIVLFADVWLKRAIIGFRGPF